MNVVGIIAEYHPFHRGHAWQIGAVREKLGADTPVVAVMSGNFVQRGDFAMFQKHARAEMALRGGADLVLELPTPWSAATAERFARGGVSILAATGVVTHLAFGCECGELASLKAVSSALGDPVFSDLLRSRFAGGMSFAAARQTALTELVGGAAQVLEKPNNALAVEYLRAINELGAVMEPLALPRIGAEHDSAELSHISSASAIRREVLFGGSWEDLVSKETAEIMRREMEAGRAPAAMKNCERAVLAKLRTMSEEEFELYDGGGEGLYHRFYHAVHSGCDVEAILDAAKTRRYPLARLRRMLLHSYLGTAEASRGELPPYLRVLGTGVWGRELLRSMAESATLPVITKPADARKLGGRVQEVFELEAKCTDLYTLAMPQLANAHPDIEFKKSVVIFAP